MFFKEKVPRPGHSPRQVKAIFITKEAIGPIMEFFAPALERGSVELLDRPPRVRMSDGKRMFVAKEGEWVVNPVKGAYFPLSDSVFRSTYEEVSD